jgi:lambda family phage minor tail protein L
VANTSNTIWVDIQALGQPSPWVQLFTLDATVLGGPVLRFTPNIYANGGSLMFGGSAFAPLPMDFTGWDELTQSSGDNGTQPRPQLVVGNASKTLLSYVVSLGDLVGAKITRVRTFQKYLDGQSNPDTSQILPADVYLFSQKTNHTNQSITWELTSPMDLPSAQLPARQVLKGPNLLSSGFPGVQVYG